MKYIVRIIISSKGKTLEPFAIRGVVEADDELLAAEKVLNDAKKVLKYNIPVGEDS